MINFNFFCFWNHIRKSRCKGQKTQSPGQVPRDIAPKGTQGRKKQKSIFMSEWNSWQVIIFVKVPPQTSQVLCAILCNCVVVLQRRTHVHKYIVGAASTIHQETNIYEFKHGITTVVQQRYYQEATTSKHNIERASLFFLTKTEASSKHKIVRASLFFLTKTKATSKHNICNSFFVFLNKNLRHIWPNFHQNHVSVTKGFSLTTSSLMGVRLCCWCVYCIRPDIVSTPFSLSFFFFWGKENSGNLRTVGALCVVY